MRSGTNRFDRLRLVPVQALDTLVGKSLRERPGKRRVDIAEDGGTGGQTLEVRQMALQIRVLNPGVYQCVEVHAVPV